jgi:excinuclease ABC subunit C
LRTALTEIRGVGPRTAQKLLLRFGSVAQLRQLTLEQLAAEVPRAQAQRVFEALREAQSSEAPSP